MPYLMDSVCVRNQYNLDGSGSYLLTVKEVVDRNQRNSTETGQGRMLAYADDLVILVSRMFSPLSARLWERWERCAYELQDVDSAKSNKTGVNVIFHQDKNIRPDKNRHFIRHVIPL